MALGEEKEDKWFYIYSFQIRQMKAVCWFPQRHCLTVFGILAVCCKDDSPQRTTDLVQ